MCDYRMDIKQYFKAENELPDSSQEHTSSSGKYTLKSSVYHTVESIGSVSLGLVFLSNDTSKPLFEVQRNFNLFPFCFVEGHPNGHDYLVCGADYQGQTVLELDTGKRVDHVPEGEKRGVGFCWAKYTASVEKDILGVVGCFWAAPDELRFVDFSEPMKLPFLVLSEFHFIDDYSALDKPWSAILGIELIDSDEVGKEKRSVIWKKPTIAEVARYWQKEADEINPASYFFPDIKAQEELAISRLQA
jgi:hypothetical protein